jgi:ubiquinol-cytochrome c reductase cytochrome b subunit
VAVFVLPVIAFWVTRRWCISLQRKDRDDLLHGYETGIIMRSPEGGYSERHLPLSTERAFRLTARDRDPDVVEELPGGADSNGVEPRGGINARLSGVRHRLRMLMYADNVQKPTLDELEEGHHHAEHEHELQAPMEGHAADGHQFDGHHLVEGEQLRSHD